MSFVCLRRVAPLAVLLLAACGDAASDQADGATATGEILPASLSDDMIPTDTLRSQAPHVQETPTTTGEDAAPEGEAEEADSAVEVEPDPAAEAPAE